MDPIHRKFYNEIESDVVSPQCTEGFYQEQSEIGAVWKVVEDGSIADDEESSVVKAEEDLVEDDLVEDDLVEDDLVEDDSVEDDSVEDDLVEGIKSEAVHRLPCLSSLSNVHVELSP
ncbi:hypothetical protein HAV15_012257 [Penicillium sp. str. |nr:hypothetical protein HAV15_012257 [Penicillium sp. str. \